MVDALVWHVRLAHFGASNARAIVPFPIYSVPDIRERGQLLASHVYAPRCLEVEPTGSSTNI